MPVVFANKSVSTFNYHEATSFITICGNSRVVCQSVCADIVKMSGHEFTLGTSNGTNQATVTFYSGAGSLDSLHELLTRMIACAESAQCLCQATVWVKTYDPREEYRIVIVDNTMTLQSLISAFVDIQYDGAMRAIIDTIIAEAKHIDLKWLNNFIHDYAHSPLKEVIEDGYKLKSE